jgi:UDP-N-acetyl-D-glucosamine/UDP-N-acetyl-D-galactosamine dehydrogenase
MDSVIGVVGLGYVGLPLAVEFGRVARTIGYDLSEQKIENFKRFEDPTGEVSRSQFEAASKLEVTHDPELLRQCDFLIVAVPTPVDEAHRPDFTPLLSLRVKTCGLYMKKGRHRGV